MIILAGDSKNRTGPCGPGTWVGRWAYRAIEFSIMKAKANKRMKKNSGYNKLTKIITQWFIQANRLSKSGFLSSNPTPFLLGRP